MPTLKPNGKRLNGRGSKWIQPKRRRAIYERDGWRCGHCRADLRDAPCHARTLDHIIPRAAGGSHHSSNLVTSCLTCNVRKQHRVPLIREANRLRRITRGWDSNRPAARASKRRLVRPGSRAA